jgi:hypothetical protein
VLLDLQVVVECMHLAQQQLGNFGRLAAGKISGKDYQLPM